MDYKLYRKKLKGCFFGKSAGGTLGMPFEGNLATRRVTYYDPVPTAMLPNDDLDNQVVNMEILMKYGLPANRLHFGEMWRMHGTGFPDEYGVATHNTEIGLVPAVTGSFNNEEYSCGLGAAIRSELFACLAPGEPEIAAALAAEDACTDHDGDGVAAERFLAAAESMAFTERDIRKVISAGLSVISGGTRLYRAIRDAVSLWDELHDIFAAREEILKRYPADNWTDVRINLAFMVISLLAADGDFSDAICYAADLGYDADCTCATVGALAGILDPDAIEDRWLQPIGDQLVLTPSVVAMHEPKTVTAFCDLIAGAAPEVLAFYRAKTTLEGDLLPSPLPLPWSDTPDLLPDPDGRTALISAVPFPMLLTYPEGISLLPGVPGTFTLKLLTGTDDRFRGTVHLSVPLGWKAEPAVLTVDSGKPDPVSFTVTPPARMEKRPARNDLILTLRKNGKAVFSVDCGLPLSMPWQILKEDGTWESYESRSAFVLLPAGPCTLRISFKIAVPPEELRVKICADRRATEAFLNGVPFASYDGAKFAPRFHGGLALTYKDFQRSERFSTIEIHVADGKESRLFFGLGRRPGCGQWLPNMEYYDEPFKK